MKKNLKTVGDGEKASRATQKKEDGRKRTVIKQQSRWLFKSQSLRKRQREKRGRHA